MCQHKTSIIDRFRLSDIIAYKNSQIIPNLIQQFFSKLGLTNVLCFILL